MIDIEQFNSLNIIAVDFETTEGTKDVLLFSLAGYKDGKELIAESYTPDYISHMLDVVKGKKLVFHQAVFELEVFDLLGLDKHRIDFEDTMIMAALLDESRSKKLKDLRKLVLGKGERDTYKSVDKEDTETFRQYNKDDAIDTIELFANFYPQIINEDLMTVYELEKKTVYPVIEMENTGCKIDVDLIMKQHDMLSGFMKDIEKRTCYTAGKYISLTSTYDKAHLLYDILGVNPKDNWRMKTGVSTSSEVLEEIAGIVANKKGKRYQELYSVVSDLINHSKFSKLTSTFVGPAVFDKLVNNRIHSHFDALGPKTGRFSSSRVNLQNIPSVPFIEGDLDTHVRSAFIAEEGRVLLTADYSQIELRMMAELSRDPSLVYAYSNGLDLHKQTGDSVNVSRRDGKTLNFSIVYGLHPKTLAKKLGKSVKESYALIDEYFKVYMGLYKFSRDIHKKVINLGYVETISGRKRRFHDLLKTNPDKYTISSIERMGFNTCIQGSAADLMKLAMSAVYFDLDHSKANIIMTVHDEITIETDIDYMTEAYHILRYHMENAVKLSVPLLADAHLGYRWSHNK
jgi:DNA polymerase I